MTESTSSRHSEQVHLLGRRSLLGLLTTAPLGLSAILLAGCAGSIPPRQYQRPPSHIVGSGRKGGGRN